MKYNIQILTEANPMLAKEWDYSKNGDLRPEDFKRSSSEKVWWLCENGHSWFARIDKRHTRGHGCPYCSGRNVWKGFNDLKTTHPHIAEEWDYDKNKDLCPEQVSYGADIKVWWKCKNEHGWQAKICSRKRNGCPVCSSKVVHTGVNDLRTIRPDLATEWDIEKNEGILPDDVSPNDKNKKWWKCRHGHSWQAIVYSRYKGSGCPYCRKKKLLIGFNDILTETPELVKEWDYEKNDPLRPEEIMGNSKKGVWWICKNGHSWIMQVAKRVEGLTCPYCNMGSLLTGYNNLLAKAPELAEEWDYERNAILTPQDTLYFSNRYVWWVCKHGHHWRTRVQARMNGAGCPYCQGRMPIRTRLVK